MPWIWAHRTSLLFNGRRKDPSPIPNVVMKGIEAQGEKRSTEQERKKEEEKL
jgi:hypothetical protein